MNCLTKQQIRESDDKRREEVPLPEWGGYVWCASVSGDVISDWEHGVSERRSGKKKLSSPRGIKAALIVQSAEDDDGNRVFDDSDIEWLEAEKSAAPINRLWDVATKLNGIGADTQKELEKNFEEATASDSGTS